MAGLTLLTRNGLSCRERRDGCVISSGPELVDPKVEVHEALGSHGVDPARPLIGNRYQLAVEKCLEMLRDRWPADRQAFCQFIDRPWLAPQLLKEITPVRISNGLESIHGHGCKLDKRIRPGKSFVCTANGLVLLGRKLIKSAEPWMAESIPGAHDDIDLQRDQFMKSPAFLPRRAAGISGSCRSRSWGPHGRSPCAGT